MTHFSILADFFAPASFRHDRLKPLFQRYINQVDQNQRKDVELAYEKCDQSKVGLSDFFEGEGQPIWELFVADIVEAHAENRDFEPFDPTVPQLLREIFQRTEPTPTDDETKKKSLPPRLLFGLVSVALGFIIPTIILLAGPYFAQQATENSATETIQKIEDKIGALNDPDTENEYRALLKQLELANRNFEDTKDYGIKLAEQRDKFSRVVDKTTVFASELESERKRLAEQAAKVGAWAKSLSEQNISIETKQTADKKVEAVDKSFSTILKELLADRDDKQKSSPQKITAALSTFSADLESLKTLKQFVDSFNYINSNSNSPQEITVTEEQAENLVLLRSESVRKSVERIKEQLPRTRRFWRAIEDVSNAEPNQEGNATTELFVSDINVLVNYKPDWAILKTTLSNNNLTSLTGIANNPEFTPLSDAQWERLGQLEKSLAKGASLLGEENLTVTEDASPSVTIQSLSKTLEEARKSQMFSETIDSANGAVQNRSAALEALTNAQTELTAVMEKLKTAGQSIDDLDSISDTVRDLAFRAVSPVMILLTIVSGLFITVGVTSITAAIKSMEYVQNRKSWRGNAQLYAEIAAVFGSQGYDAASILRLMQDESPKLDKSSNAVSTPVTQILSEGRRLIREFKKL